MSNLIELKKENILVSSTVLNYDKPDFIYILIFEDTIIKVKKGEKVKIGSVLTIRNNEVSYSPISGIVIDIKKMNSLNGLQNYIEIENDFKELKERESLSKRNLSGLEKEKFESYLPSSLVSELNTKKTFILNCLDDEPYVLTENFYLLSYYEGYLEVLDKISKLYNLDIIICVKSSNGENISNLNSTLGMYPHINLNICPNLYLLGRKDFLLHHFNLKNEESIVIRASHFYDIYNIVKRNSYTSSMLITISGNGVKNPSIIKVKIGTKLDDLIKEYIKLEDEKIVFFANGLMHKTQINIKDFIITKEINSIIIMKDIENIKEEKCINCGACINICPVNLNPILLSNKIYRSKVKGICLECGLCSYICPSYINFNKYLEGDTQND